MQIAIVSWQAWDCVCRIEGAKWKIYYTQQRRVKGFEHDQGWQMSIFLIKSDSCKDKVTLKDINTGADTEASIFLATSYE